MGTRYPWCCRYNRTVRQRCLISFEGIEGSGKSTQVALLMAHLQRQGIAAIAIREPGGTALGERLREVLLDPGSAPTARAELFILEAARAHLVDRVIRPALEAGRMVIADRFADSSVVYQGVARGLGIPIVEQLNQMACAGVAPDRTLVLDLPVEVGLDRARSRRTTTATNRRFEDEDDAFHRAVAEGYRDLATRHPRRVRLVDARGSAEEVHARVLAALTGLVP
ncbi:MAG: dTMP kinase [Acidobacteriota bacterium]